MSGDPRIAPSAARERKAHAAGLRPRVRWLVLGGLCGAALASLSGWGAGGLARGLGLAAALAGSDPGAALAGASRSVIAGTLGIAAVVVAVVAIVGIATGEAGAVSSAERRRFRVGPIPLRPSTSLLGALGLVIGAAALLRGIVAGAARAPASTEAGLSALFGGAAMQVLFVMMVLLGLAGALELVGSRWANRRALFQTEAQAREDARRDGGLRG